MVPDFNTSTGGERVYVADVFLSPIQLNQTVETNVTLKTGCYNVNVSEILMELYFKYEGEIKFRFTLAPHVVLATTRDGNWKDGVMEIPVHSHVRSPLVLLEQLSREFDYVTFVMNDEPGVHYKVFVVEGPGNRGLQVKYGHRDYLQLVTSFDLVGDENFRKDYGYTENMKYVNGLYLFEMDTLQLQPKVVTMDLHLESGDAAVITKTYREINKSGTQNVTSVFRGFHTVVVAPEEMGGVHKSTNCYQFSIKVMGWESQLGGIKITCDDDRLTPGPASRIRLQIEGKDPTYAKNEKSVTKRPRLYRDTHLYHATEENV